jgi:hypothetical protein
MLKKEKEVRQRLIKPHDVGRSSQGVGSQLMSASQFSFTQETTQFRKKTEGVRIISITRPPLHTLSSLSWTRSEATLPKTIAPNRPEPSGRARFQLPPAG